MQKHEVVYLMSSPAHLPYLIVSLRTLRKLWQGRVRVFAWPESFEIAKEIAKDDRLKVRAELSEPEYRARRDEGRQGKNDQFIHKIDLMRSLRDVDLALYLDADTSVHGDLMPLFRAAKRHGFCATRFSSWTTAGKIPRSRIERLKEVSGIDRECIEAVLRQPWPSVNGGVFATRPESPVLELWKRWTWEARHQFIADEAVLHVLQPKFTSEKMVVWPDGRFNCSCNPRWMPEKMSESEVVVWHYHGDSNARPDKFGGAGVRRWWPMWEECLKDNVGNVQDWKPREENGWLGSRWFAELEQKEMQCES